MTDQLDIPESGYLELFLGPMWAGKTSELVDIYHFAKDHDIKCIAINHTFDLSSKQLTIQTHDNVSIPCVSSDTLTHIFDTGEPPKEFDYDMILINEGQFFPDLYEWTKYMVNSLHKTIYVAALDGDYQQVGFSNIMQLIPQADIITKLHNKCKECNHSWAIFTHRTTQHTSQILPGTEHYIPLCRNCYNKRV
jgi:thymidine kinase